MGVPQTVVARRCEVLNVFKSSSYLPRSKREQIAQAHGVTVYRVSEDLKKLRDVGCLRLRGAGGCYQWLKPYDGKQKRTSAKKKTKIMKCYIPECNTMIESEHTGHRMCEVHRKKTWGLI